LERTKLLAASESHCSEPAGRVMYLTGRLGFSCSHGHRQSKLYQRSMNGEIQHQQIRPRNRVRHRGYAAATLRIRNWIELAHDCLNRPDNSDRTEGFAGHAKIEYGPLFLLRKLAEREGFEPPVRLPGQLISSQPHSTTLPPLLNCISHPPRDAARRRTTDW